MKTAIEIAREAGAGIGTSGRWLMTHTELERFAELVAAAEHEAIIDLVAMYGGSVDLEAAIRARSNT